MAHVQLAPCSHQKTGNVPARHFIPALWNIVYMRGLVSKIQQNNPRR